MPFFRRVPRLSKPFVKAAILDAAAMGILLGAINPFAGVITRRLGAGPVLLGLLSIAPFIGFLSAGLISRMMYRVRWGRFMAVLRILSRFPLIAMAAVSGPVLFVGILACLQILTNWSKVLCQATIIFEVDDN